MPTSPSPTHEVEERDGRFHVTLPDLGLELAPVFDHRLTAAEIAARSEAGHDFFQMIPTVDIGTPYPRPNRARSPVHKVDLSRHGFDSHGLYKSAD